jgi:cytochrome P450
VTATTTSEIYYDPHQRDVMFNPHPLFRRMREEAPLYYNEVLDFYALTRFDDVERAHVDRDTFISSRGGTLDILKANIEIPPGTVIFEDPPTHTVHRSLLSRMFTGRRVAELEGQIRQLCADLLDPHVGAGGFDVMTDFGKLVPMRVIGMLVGIPEGDQEAIRDHVDAAHKASGDADHPTDLGGALFADYVDWRADHPSDDIMTQLLEVEFEDENGVRRRLRREELLAYVSLVAAAGDETTRLTIGWMAKLLGEHPDQRRLLVEDPGLAPGAVE